MSKVIVDKVKIEEFLTRGVEKIYPSVDEFRELLLSGTRIKVYQGYDPTGPYLHVGHAIGMRAMRLLQEMGHEIIFLVGDYTARVGDPDKKTGRKLLTDEDIERNMRGWREQAGRLIDFEGENAVKFEMNSKWLSEIRMIDLINLMSKATVQQMIERDMFQRRLKEGDPIGLQEFIYPLMQGYDGMIMNVDLEIGGTDQTFNMLMGRNISKAYTGKNKFVRAHKLMDAPDGITMSKTRGNGINLSDLPTEMFGKAMSYRDESILLGLELLTDIPMNRVNEISNEIESGANPMIYKKILAYEIVKSIYGENDAKDAQKYFEDVYQNKQGSDDIVDVVINQGNDIVSVVKAFDSTLSNSQIIRLIEQGAIKVNDERVLDKFYVVSVVSKPIVRVGKKVFRCV